MNNEVRAGMILIKENGCGRLFEDFQIGWVERRASRCISSSLQIQILTSVFYIKFIILNNQTN